MTLKQLFDSLVRDATKVEPISKGEMKRRLKEIMLAYKDRMLTPSLSDCCFEPIELVLGEEGTNCFVCSKCNKPCNWI